MLDAGGFDTGWLDVGGLDGSGLDTGGLWNMPDSDRRFKPLSSASTSVIDCQRASGFLRRQRITMSASSPGTSGMIS
jgi:hypothetical protein